MSGWRGAACNQPCFPHTVDCLEACGCWRLALQQGAEAEFFKALKDNEREAEEALNVAREPKRLIPKPA